MKRYHYYKKDKKAQVYRVMRGGQDPDGYTQPDGFYPVAPKPIWCYSKQLTQNQLFQNRIVGCDETRFFVFNYMPDIRLYDAVVYEGIWYEITRVDRADDYKTDLFVYVELWKPGVKPSDEQIFPYDPEKTR